MNVEHLYPSLSTLTESIEITVNASATKVCIATPDFVGMVKNGGIGTSFHHTAKLLSENGFDVTVLYCKKNELFSNNEVEKIKNQFKHIGFELICLFEYFESGFEKKFSPDYIVSVTSYLTYQYLKTTNFDIIIFPDWRGVGYYSTLAKKQRIAFQNTALCVQTHSSSLWHDLNNQNVQYDPQKVWTYHMERGSISNADIVISPTRYLLDWKTKHGFQLPNHTYVQPYLFNFGDLPKTRASDKQQIRELIFFGRLERRKGIHLFVEAVCKLAVRRRELDHSVKITFLGKFTKDLTGHIVDQILEKLGKCPFVLNFLTTLDHQQAITYIGRESCLPVICSVADNAPLTVLECLYFQVPFLASRVGGIPELIAQEDYQGVLFEPTPNVLCDKFIEAINNGATTARPATNQRKNLETWLNALKCFKSQFSVTSQVLKATSETVSVCITHFNRANFLKTTLAGISNQTFQPSEIIIVDDGSTDSDAIDLLKKIEAGNYIGRCKVIYQNNRFVGAARNRGLREVTSEFVVFMDDDNFACSNQLEIFVTAIVNGRYDALTCCAITFEDNDDPETTEKYKYIYLPLGGSVSAGMFSNCYGDANGIYRTSALREVGGFTEDYGTSWEDCELLAKLNLEGYRVDTIPETLMWLRSTAGSVSRVGTMVPNVYRSYRPFLSHLPWDTFGDATLVAMSHQLQRFVRLDKQDLGETVETNNFKQLIMTTEDGTADNLQMVHTYLIKTGRELLARDILLQNALYSSDCRHLLINHILIHNKPEEVSAAALQLSCIESTKADIHIKSANAVLNYKQCGNWSELLSTLKEACENPTSNTETYKLIYGLLCTYTDNIAEGFYHLSSFLDKIDRAYVMLYPDLAECLIIGTIRSGIAHYLEHGRKEGRKYSFVPCAHNIFLSDCAETSTDFAGRIRQAVYAGENAWPRLNEVYIDLLKTDLELELYYCAREMLSIAEAEYLNRNSEVQALIMAGQFDSGYDHFRSLSLDESRLYMHPTIDKTNLDAYINLKNETEN